MTSAGGIGKQEFQALLSDVAAQHQRMAASLDALASRVEDMSVEQVEEAAVGGFRVRSLGDSQRSLTSSTKVRWRYSWRAVGVGTRSTRP